MKKTISLFIIAAAILAGFPARTAAQSQTPGLNVRFLLQSWAQFSEKGSPDKTAWDKDFFIRRARIILSGTVNDWISFFAETDTPNWGKGGQWSASLFLQDAYVDFLLAKNKGVVDSLDLDAGMILLPFSHHSRQSAASLNTLDYHSALIQFPAASNKAWRDVGLEARGLFFKKHIDVRTGVFNGLRGTDNDPLTANPQDAPRWTGRIQANLFDAEDAFFYGGNHFGAKKIVSIGLGFDHQTDANAVRQGTAKQVNLYDRSAWTADVFIDYPLDKNTNVVFQANYFSYDSGAAEETAAIPYEGKSFGIEAGVRYKMIEPVLSYEKFNPKNRDVRPGDDAENFRLGFNWWIKAHNANIKAEYGLLKTYAPASGASTRGVWTFQVQLFY